MILKITEERVKSDNKNSTNIAKLEEIGRKQMEAYGIYPKADGSGFTLDSETVTKNIVNNAIGGSVLTYVGIKSQQASVGKTQSGSNKSVSQNSVNNVSGSNLNKLTPSEITSMSLDELRNSIPKDWQIFENNGRVHIKDVKGNFRVRINPPDNTINYQHMHIYDSSGNSLDKTGSIVDRTSPDGHIPWENK